MTTTWPALDPDEILQKLHRCGPDRVVVDADGLGEPSARARARGIVPDVVFVRRDGWMLAAPKRFAAVAYRMWADEWLAFIDRREPITVRSIAEYKP